MHFSQFHFPAVARFKLSIITSSLQACCAHTHTRTLRWLLLILARYLLLIFGHVNMFNWPNCVPMGQLMIYTLFCDYLAVFPRPKRASLAAHVWKYMGLLRGEPHLFSFFFAPFGTYFIRPRSSSKSPINAPNKDIFVDCVGFLLLEFSSFRMQNFHEYFLCQCG